MMREANAFPPKTDLTDTLEFYFQCCSIEINVDKMSIVAATLANGGVNPLTVRLHT
jgi:glutaminase